MSIINISEFQNIGPFFTDVSAHFQGYANGFIKIVDGNGNELARSGIFNHEVVDITISGIQGNRMLSAMVEAQEDPSFHGSCSIGSGEKQSISQSDFTNEQIATYRSIRISIVDENGTAAVIHSSSMDSQFDVPLQNGRMYVIELLCPNEQIPTICDCQDILIMTFSYSSQKTSIIRDDIPSEYFEEQSDVFNGNRDKIRIYRISDGSNLKESVYLGSKDDQFNIEMQQGYSYHLYAECSCKIQNVVEFTVSEYTNNNLIPYQDATQFGIQDGTPWRLIETGYPYKYFEGVVSGGRFVGLPDNFRPIRYTYNGHMKLQIGCFNDDVDDGQCWPDDHDFPTCEQHESVSFTSGQTVNLIPYQNTAQYGALYDGMTWGLFDETHGIFVLRGVYAGGVLYETDGNTSVEVTSQTALRDSYTSTYEGNSAYKMVFRCDGYYPFYKYYVIGFCGRKNTDIELTDKEYFTGNLNTLYTIAESQLYPANTCYNDKRMNILAGPFDTHDLAENHKNSYSSSLLSTLDQQCQNRMTFDITWNGDNGCDLDISFLVEGVSMGWYQQNNSPYATWYGDDTSCGGAEQVSIDKNAMIADGIKTTTIVLRAHWHAERRNGNCNFVASDGNTSIMRSFNSVTKESSNENYDVLGSVTIDLENDTFTVTGGEEQQEASRSNSLLTLLPEDLR